MNKQEIMNILPHRNSMLLIDEAEVVDGKAHAKKYIKGDEFFLDGHFPDYPVVPGVILCEILFTGLNNVKFKNVVRPGDTFETECEIVRVKEPFYFAKGKGTVNGKLCVSAEFSFAIVEKDS